MNRYGLLAAGLLLAACGPGPTEPGPEADARLALFEASCPDPAPLHLAPGERVPDSYIVVLHDSVSDASARTEALEQQHGFTATHRYTTALQGFAAHLSPQKVAALRCEADVAYIEENATVSIDG